MSLDIRFAVVSDPHIAVPETIWEHPNRFHLVEVSTAALEQVLTHLSRLDLDFLLVPGDLTQHGEPANHRWLAARLQQLPYPVYVVPGNHDIVHWSGTDKAIAAAEFPHYYRQFGYSDLQQLDYTQELCPGLRLVGLNSNTFGGQGENLGYGYLDSDQMHWLKDVLVSCPDDLIMVMIHHNVIEHLPGQASHGMGRRYMLANAPELLQILHSTGVPLIFTGHLHIQDIACWKGIYEVTTGSLVSYPHPYRICRLREDNQGHYWLLVESERVQAVPGREDLLHFSREWMGDRSFPFMVRLLTLPPFNLPMEQAETFAPQLRYFWADIATGDRCFTDPDLPPELCHHLHRFSAIDRNGHLRLVDNHIALKLHQEGRQMANTEV
jgi:hypothetical protein